METRKQAQRTKEDHNQPMKQALTLALNVIIFKVTFVRVAVCPRENAMALLHSLTVETLEL